MMIAALSALAGSAWRRVLPYIAAAGVVLGIVLSVFRSGRRAGADAARADVARRDAAAAERARAAGQAMGQAQVEQRPSSTSATVIRLRDRKEI